MYQPFSILNPKIDAYNIQIMHVTCNMGVPNDLPSCIMSNIFGTFHQFRDIASYMTK